MQHPLRLIKPTPIIVQVQERFSLANLFALRLFDRFTRSSLDRSHRFHDFQFVVEIIFAMLHLQNPLLFIRDLLYAYVFHKKYRGTRIEMIHLILIILRVNYIRNLSLIFVIIFFYNYFIQYIVNIYYVKYFCFSQFYIIIELVF